MTDINLISDPISGLALVKSGVITLDATATVENTTITTTVPHNLNFIPTSFGFITYFDLYYIMPFISGMFDNGLYVGMNAIVWLSVDSTNIYLKQYSAVTANKGTYACKYFLFRDRANQ